MEQKGVQNEAPNRNRNRNPYKQQKKHSCLDGNAIFKNPPAFDPVQFFTIPPLKLPPL